MRTRRVNFAMIAVLGVAVLSAVLEGQTKADEATARDAGKHPAFQVKAAGEGRAIIMIPGLVFQGEEWAASSPFPHFADHRDPDLARVISEGRKQEFAPFGWDPASISGPEIRKTFESA